MAAPRESEKYQRVEKGPMSVGLLCLGLLFLILSSGFAPADPASTELEDGVVRLILGSVGVLLLLLAPLFGSLTVGVDTNGVQARYGPVPLFRRQVPFTEIESSEAGRSALIDGLGIHFVPGRGWTWNLWSRGCVELHLRGGRTWRIGSPEPEALAAAIEAHRRTDDENPD